MSFENSSVPTKTKKIIYLISWVILGALLSFLAHAFIELKYLSWAGDNNYTVVWYGGCALPPLLRVGLFALGAVGGFLLGKYFWRKIYIEQAYWKRKNTK